MFEINLFSGKYIYFSSDNHLGAPDSDSSFIREQHFVRWLDKVKDTAQAIFLLGDLFDFWVEYKKVVPKGFVRVLGKLAEITDSGIPIYFFVGNHDLWMRDYFEKELHIPVFFEPQIFRLNKKMFFIGHGDGLGDGDLGYKRMKKIFVHPLAKFLFRWIHPDIGIGLGQYMSTKNALISGDEDAKYLGEKEWLLQFCKHKLEESYYDFFVFGHRHLPLDIPLPQDSKYINLGDWIKYFSYGIFNGKTMKLETFKP